MGKRGLSLHTQGLLFGLFGALVVALVTMFGPHGLSVKGTQDRLGALVSLGLKARDYDFATVAMRGQTVVLTGEAPSPEAAKVAEKLALKAAGPGGPLAGGVTKVVNRLSAGAAASPFVWTAATEGGAVRFTGFVPSAEAKAGLTAGARTMFPKGVADGTAVAEGAPPGPWDAVAMDALGQIALLDSGQARLVDRKLVIMGEGDKAAVNLVRSHYRDGAPAPFEVVLDVNVKGEGLAIPEIRGISLADGDPKACQQAFSRIMAKNVINFDTGSAAILASSRRVLDNLAAVARRCDRYRIEVAGHTDNVGERAANMELSRARAEAVAAYLAAQGVTRDRLSAAGYGPDRPTASNATLKGQAMNRRIEFAVRT